MSGCANKTRAWQTPSKDRPCDCPIWEQHETASATTVRSKAKGRNSLESKDGTRRSDVKERFYETARLLGLVHG
ncbi:hypothetical protein DAEQUDRAFT_721516 [Daedalea quercina L-15889]|uniref:Uncharacterized protein n=1 Tax=Daedalea quercina L-15889 TaxID=1314783 RepID=A0A165THV8_9APHY|nr:hypothetical protein DAEQUDRAFT_721516 [Daedalea quercina L-15889]